MFKKVFFNILFLSLIFGKTTLASENKNEVVYEGKIIKLLEDKDIDFGGIKQRYQILEIQITNKDKKGQSIQVENGNQPVANNNQYKVGDRLLIGLDQDLNGKDTYLINDYIRNDGIYLLLICFILLTLVVAKFRGITSIGSMVLTFIIIIKYILPQLINGYNPILIAISGSLLIIPITFYVSHGFNKKTHIAVAGTILAMIIIGILSMLFIEMTKLTGFSSEEAGFLNIAKQGGLNMKGILLAGIIIGAIGVLDDITVAQSGIVEQLKNASEKLKFGELYKMAMKVGQDHIASMINTLILVYTGAALPLMLIFINNPHPITEIINYEFIAEEIVRTLVGSIGLILAVPITTLIAASVFSKKRK